VSGILILGYGNTLRSDDAMGIHAAHELQNFYCDDAGVRVLATSQLMVELAEDVSQAQLVLFVDAAEGGTPGRIFIENLTPQEEAVRFTHHCPPRTLLAAARHLYGSAPEAMSITMAGSSFEVGMGLSTDVQSNLPTLLDDVKKIVADWRLKAAEAETQAAPSEGRESELLPH